MSTTMKTFCAAVVALGLAAPVAAQVRTVPTVRQPVPAPASPAVAQARPDGPGRAAPAGFAARGDRTSDGVIARDLAWFDSLEAAARGRAASQRNAAMPQARLAAYVALAREAYLRNDDGRLTAELLARAGVLTGATPAVPERNRELWLVASDPQRAGARDTAVIGRAVALEMALLRAEHPLLGAPDCSAWQATAQRLATELRTLVPEAPAPMPVLAATPATPAPAAVMPAAAPVPEAAGPSVKVDAPRELRGVPSRVHFGLDRSDLSPASRRALDALVDSLRAFPEVRIVLYGHTDMRASAAYNAALSRRRAVSVQQYLIARGVAASRMEYVAKGKSQLEQGGTGVTEHARNRRVEMQFIAPDGTEIPSLQQLDDLQLESPRNARPARRARPRSR
ncbi:MAG: OmpA family protein [Gemmatimonadaceae bacterium]|nr:OmpA family protein [Gemmatimonadaceae bacterium]